MEFSCEVDLQQQQQRRRRLIFLLYLSSGFRQPNAIIRRVFHFHASQTTDTRRYFVVSFFLNYFLSTWSRKIYRRVRWAPCRYDCVSTSTYCKSFGNHGCYLIDRRCGKNDDLEKESSLVNRCCVLLALSCHSKLSSRPIRSGTNCANKDKYFSFLPPLTDSF